MMPRRHLLRFSRRPLHPHSQTLSIALLLGVVVFLCQALFWHARIRADYFPAGDEFALLVHSTRVFQAHPSEWVLRGFADYFRPYPDLAIPYSEFLRPVDNLLYYGNSWVFQGAWERYLLLNYLVVAAVAAITYGIASAFLRLPAWGTALVTVAAIASPAYTHQVLYRPSFAFDYVAALFSLACVLCLLQKRWLLAWALTLLAVFSKETGYYVALSASAAVLICWPHSNALHRLRRACLYLIPLALMFALRMSAFHRTTGVYVLHGATPLRLLKNAVLGATSWPYRLPGEQHVLSLSLTNLGSLLCTAAIWLLMLGLGARLLRSRTVASQEIGDRSTVLPILFVFLLGAISLPLLLDLQPRFGASAYPLLFLNLGALLTYGRRDVLARLATVCLVVLAVANLWELRRQFSSQYRAAEAQSWTMARSLVHQLQEQPGATKFLVGDSVGAFSAGEVIRRFSGTTAQVVPVVNLEGGSCRDAMHIDDRPVPGGYLLHATAACGTYTLFATGKTRETGALLQRDIPSASISYRSNGPEADPEIYDWTSVDIDIQPKVTSYSILIPVAETGTFRVLGAGATR